MFKEENIEFVNKLFCFLIFILVIAFINNIFSLLVLFCYFFLMEKKENSLVSLILNVLTIFGFALGFVNNSLVLLRIILIIDYAYYFIHHVGVNKVSALFSIERKESSNNSEKIFHDDNIDNVKEELKKGKLLKEEEISSIESNLKDKSSDNQEERKLVDYLHFGSFKNRSFKWNWKFTLDDVNGIYTVCHLLILILAIVVE